MKVLYKRVGFNFEYSFLIAIFTGLLVSAIGVLSTPDIKDGAAWVQAICGICTLVAVLAIAAIQRKHAYLQSIEDSNIYTLKAYQVAEQAVGSVTELNNIDKLMAPDDVERQLTSNGLAILLEAVNGFEVSRMSSADAAIALLKVKQHIRDVETIYSTSSFENIDKIYLINKLDVLVDSATKDLKVLKDEVSFFKEEAGPETRKKLFAWGKNKP